MYNDDTEMNMIEFAKQLLAVAGDQWKLEPDKEGRLYYADISGPSGEKLCLHRPSWNKVKGAISVTGSFPWNINGQQMFLSSYEKKEKFPNYKSIINISAKKTPVQIWKEIEKRFLPNYREVLAYLNKQRDGNLQFEMGCRNLADEIERVAGGSVWRQSPDHKGVPAKTFRLSSKNDNGYGDIEVTSPTTITIHLRSMKREPALEMLAILKNL